MQRFVAGWCDLIGISDVGAIQIAVGVVGASTLLILALLVWTAFGMVVQHFSAN